MISLFQKRKDLMVSLLKKVPGFEVWPSKGAFYMFPNVSEALKKTKLTSEELVDYMINKYFVVTLPGSVFPDKAGFNFIRLSFASSTEAIKEGVQRIQNAVEELMQKK